MEYKNQNNLFMINTLLIIVKKQKKFIITFTLLITVLAMTYKHYLNDEYNNSPSYHGTLIVKLGKCIYLNEEKIENKFTINKYKFKKYLQKINNVTLTYPHPLISNKIILNITHKDKSSIKTSLYNALALLNKKESKYFEKKLSVVSNSLKVNVIITLSHAIDEVNIKKQELSLNNYFVFCVFLLGLIASTILSVFLNKIEYTK